MSELAISKGSQLGGPFGLVVRLNRDIAAHAQVSKWHKAAVSIFGGMSAAGES